MNKKALSERDICTKFNTPAVELAGWDIQRQMREVVTFTKGRVIVRGKLHTLGQARRADYVLYHQPNLPIAVIEAKDNSHGPGDGMQQALEYAEALDVPFAFTSNGDGFVFHGRFLALCLNAGKTAHYLEQAKSGMAASQVNISQAKLKGAPIPIPPLAEQRRIVAKFTELLALCDQLKSRLAAARAKHAELAEALVAQAVV